MPVALYFPGACHKLLRFYPLHHIPQPSSQRPKRMLQPEQLMHLAIDAARAGIAAGQTPFGCAIASGAAVIASGHNRVLASTDITAHAEIVAIRAACRATGEVHLA